MDKDCSKLLEERLDSSNFSKLLELNNKSLLNFVSEYVELCNPKSVFVRTDSSLDADYIKQKSLSEGEEKGLRVKGHTIHFDGVSDQARDKKNTCYLVSEDNPLKGTVNCVDKEEGTKEIREILKDVMAGKEMYVCFFCLGPVNSEFSILAAQITDSAYVCHSEDLLYRQGYEQFKSGSVENNFFKFVHSAGELENCVSKNVDKRRVYIDLEKELVYSTNTQYAGNTVGLKKLSLRLAIQKASREEWLAEHMFIMGVTGENGKKEYLCGAYPSMCGKTSTAILNGETIIGDDIAYLRIKGGRVYAVNVERGIFGIIKDINVKDDPIVFKSLSTEGEAIFSNILVDEQKNPYWIGKDKNPPAVGVNYAGEWSLEKRDSKGDLAQPSHKNARYTIRLSVFENVDENLESPEGVPISGLIYGGRDSDTSVPIEQAFSWEHGIVCKAASLESETTAATLGQEGVRVFNPMSNIDFLSISLGGYIDANLNFSKKLETIPPIFGMNYFLRDKEGKFLNDIQDKRIWLKWICRRVRGEAGGLLSPTGIIPKYDDLKDLFDKVLDKEYSQQEYDKQFIIRIPENLAKIERIRNVYRKIKNISDILFKELDDQEQRLKDFQLKHGDYILPDKLEQV